NVWKSGMSEQLRNRLLAELSEIRLIDPHSHIELLQPASRTLADILGYNHYTYLAHSAGMPREQCEPHGLAPKEKVGRLVEWLPALSNTIQAAWLVELCQEFFGFQDEHITRDNWEALYDRSAEIMASPDWGQQVLNRSNVEAVFLT